MIFSICFRIIEQMTFIPTSLQPVPQILWQPVVVGQLHNETIEQLKRENDLLKQQLDLVLSGKLSPRSNNKPTSQSANYTERCQPYQTHRHQMSMGPTEINCYSPRSRNYYEQRSCVQSPRFKPFLSPNRVSETQREQSSIGVDNTAIKRMIIQKSPNGRYYRDHFQEMQQSCINDRKHSNLNKLSTQQTSLRTTPITTPTRVSDPLQDIQHSSIQQNQLKTRLSSPGYFKSKQKQNFNEISSPFMKNKVNRAKDNQIFEAHKLFLQEKEEYRKQKAIDADFYRIKAVNTRKQSRIPTLELSGECDSDISIERKLKQGKRKERKQKSKSNFDQFLYQIQRNLDNMYGTK